MKIRHFCIIAQNPALLKKFYSELLETPPSFTSETSEYCEFNAEQEAKLDIDPLDVLALEIGQGPASEKRPLIRIEADDVDGVFAQSLAKKFQTLTEPKKKPWGEKSFHLLDPEGNLIEIFQKL